MTITSFLVITLTSAMSGAAITTRCRFTTVSNWPWFSGTTSAGAACACTFGTATAAVARSVNTAPISRAPRTYDMLSLPITYVPGCKSLLARARRGAKAGAIRCHELRVNSDEAGAGHDDEQGRQNQEDEREQHLHGRLVGALLDALASPRPRLVSLRAQHLRDVHAELHRAHERRGERHEVFHPGPGADRPHRGLALSAEGDLVQVDPDLLGGRPAPPRGHGLEGLVQSEPRFHGHGQEIERLRQIPDDPRLPAPDGPTEFELRPQVAEQAGRDREQQRLAKGRAPGQGQRQHTHGRSAQPLPADPGEG